MNILTEALTWHREHVWLDLVGAGSWLLVLLLTMVAVRYYLIWIPADHFAKGHKPLDAWRDSHPALRWTILIGKNLIGGTLALIGLIMLVTPGPGWFALLLGLSMVDIPGKRAVEQRIVQRPAILAFVNRLRAKARQSALQFDPKQPATES